MVELSEGVKQKAFYMAMIGYVATVMVIFFYYFNLNSLFFEIFSGVVSVLLFPIFFIAVLSRNPEPSKVTRKRMEQMDIENFLKPIDKAFSNKPTWLILGLSITLFYTLIMFSYSMASHYLAFYAIAIWLLYKKEYLPKSAVESN